MEVVKERPNDRRTQFKRTDFVSDPATISTPEEHWWLEMLSEETRESLNEYYNNLRETGERSRDSIDSDG